MAGRRGSSIVLQRKESTARAAGMDQSFNRDMILSYVLSHPLDIPFVILFRPLTSVFDFCFCVSDMFPCPSSHCCLLPYSCHLLVFVLVQQHKQRVPSPSPKEVPLWAPVLTFVVSPRPTYVHPLLLPLLLLVEPHVAKFRKRIGECRWCLLWYNDVGTEKDRRE